MDVSRGGSEQPRAKSAITLPEAKPWRIAATGNYWGV